MHIEEHNLSDDGLNEMALGINLWEDGFDSENEHSQGEDQRLSGDYADSGGKDMMNWQTLVAFLAITGTNRMTVAQFGSSEMSSTLSWKQTQRKPVECNHTPRLNVRKYHSYRKIATQVQLITFFRLTLMLQVLSISLPVS